MAVAGGWGGGGIRSYCWVGIVFQWGRWKSSADGRWWWSHKVWMHIMPLNCARAHAKPLQPRLSEAPWTVARQAPLSVEFSRYEYWSGLPCPPPGDLPNPKTEPMSPAACRQFLYLWVTREVPLNCIKMVKMVNFIYILPQKHKR